MRHAVFVVPFVFETSLRFLRRALALPGVRIGLVTQDPLERFPKDAVSGIAAHWRVDDAMNPSDLVGAVQGLRRQMGGAERLVGVLEQLQVPLARAREELDIPGLDVEAALNFRDKSRMKQVLRDAGLPCARHGLAESVADVHRFVEEVGFPIVVKPPAGAGAVNTFRLNDVGQLAEALAAFPPHPQRPALLEEFVTGREHSFDAVCVGGRPVWHSISRYDPTPLEVMENEWIQWAVLLPQQIDGPEFDDIRRVGPVALSALGMGTGLAHMEWFRRPDGGLAVSEVGARPPGAQFTTLMSWAHDTDMYSAWSRLMVLDEFDPPTRRYAVGAAYLRGQGRGRVAQVHGLEQAQREMGELVVEVRLPKPGQDRASSYEGEGYVILRHADTEVVADALRRAVSLIRVELR